MCSFENLATKIHTKDPILVKNNMNDSLSLDSARQSEVEQTFSLKDIIA